MISMLLDACTAGIGSACAQPPTKANANPHVTAFRMVCPLVERLLPDLKPNFSVAPAFLARNGSKPEEKPECKP
jgi:hypothetical protein